ncbi:MAG: ABC transporter ATP-binding protein [Spirochaetales bacterium]|nr:ABC transporter ATP-binding protein [Spirochaetales bacterium]
MDNIVVSINSLVKKYDNFLAVNELSFKINKGEIYGLLGPNGAGKTTTLECIEGIKHPDAGEIEIAGYDPQKDKKFVREMLGVQLQSSSLPQKILVDEAVKLFCTWHKTGYRSDLVSDFGLEDLLKKQYGNLSTGQQRRLHLALALIHNPEVIILDEPTAGLDAPGRAQLHKQIRELKKRGVTVLLATHDMAEAECLCDRISIIIRGKNAVSGTPSEVIKAGRIKTRIAIRTANGCINKDCIINNAEYLKSDDFYSFWECSNIAIGIESLIHKVKQNNDRLIDLKIEPPSLEESFLELVNNGENK